MTTSAAVPPSGLAPVVVTTCSDAAAWDAYVQQAPDATGYHLWGWRDIFDGVFHHRCEYLAASRQLLQAAAHTCREVGAALAGAGASHG